MTAEPTEPVVAPQRVLVVDDQRSFAQLLAMALEATGEYEVVGHARTLAECVPAVGRTRPDIVVMDLRLPDGDGISGTRRVLALYPTTRVVVLTAQPGSEVVLAAAQAGACGFAPKDGSLEEVLATLRTARNGGLTLAPGAVTQTLIPAQRASSAVDGALTPRELDVVRLLSDGHDARTAANRLGISLHTCRGHTKAIFAKLGVHTQLAAVAEARRRGLLYGSD